MRVRGTEIIALPAHAFFDMFDIFRAFIFLVRVTGANLCFRMTLQSFRHSGHLDMHYRVSCRSAMACRPVGLRWRLGYAAQSRSWTACGIAKSWPMRGDRFLPFKFPVLSYVAFYAEFEDGSSILSFDMWNGFVSESIVVHCYFCYFE